MGNLENIQIKTINRLYLGIITFALLISSILFASSFRSYDSGFTRHYNGSGLIKRDVRQYHLDVTPTTGNGGSYNITALGLTNIIDVQATIVRNTSTVGDAPAISIKTISTSAITYNIVQANPSTVAILGINVLNGSPQAFPSSPSDITIKFTITGY